MQRLEARLGTRLLERTTRAVHLTEDGQTYLQAARAAIDSLKEAEETLLARRLEPAGRVRLDMPIGFGGLLLPGFAALSAQYPKVTLELSLSDRRSDAVAEGWDLVIRIGELPADSDLVVRKLCDLKLGLYAAPAYLASHKPIKTIGELSEHPAIVFRAASGRLRRWQVMETGGISALQPQDGLIVSDGRAVVDAAIAGLGIAQIFDRVAAPHVRSGALGPVLPGSEVDGPAVHAIIPAGHAMPPKTRAVIEHLARELRTDRG